MSISVSIENVWPILPPCTGPLVNKFSSCLSRPATPIKIEKKKKKKEEQYH